MEEFNKLIISLSLREVTPISNIYLLRLKAPLSNENIIEICGEDMPTTNGGYVTNLGNNSYICSVFNGGDQCNLCYI